MPGYLDQYGAGDERRIKIIKTIAISLISIAVIGGILFFVFHNYREEQRVKQAVPPGYFEDRCIGVSHFASNIQSMTGTGFCRSGLSAKFYPGMVREPRLASHNVLHTR